MNVLRKLLIISFIAIFYNSKTVLPSYDAKQFAFENLDKVAKYQMFTRGTIKDKTVFDLAFPLAQREMFDEDIFNTLKSIDPFFYYQNKKESLERHKAFLIGKITGFIDALKNQIKMFYVLQPGILVIAQEPESEISTPVQEKPKQPSSQDDDQPTPLAIADKNVQWAEEEFIIELDYYIMRYIEIRHQRPNIDDFTTWLKDYYHDAIAGDFNYWITRRLNPFTARQAKAELQFTVDSIIFFISDYIPQTLIAQNQKRSAIDWQILKNTFPGFIIYENRDLFRFAGDGITKRTITFLLDIVNQRLKILSEDTSLGQLVLFNPTPNQDFEPDMINTETTKQMLIDALKIASSLV